MKIGIREEKGITLLMLVIIIIILVIISGVTIYNVNEAIDSAKLSAFTTELKIMQAQVNTMNKKMKNDEEINVNGSIYKGKGRDFPGIQDIGQKITEDLEKQANEAFNACRSFSGRER